jgi:hypothetical protein
MDASDLFVPHIPDGWSGGRNPHDGYARGLTLWGSYGRTGTAKCRLDEDFGAAFPMLVERSMVGLPSLMNLFLLVKFYLPRLLAADQEAAIVEFGVCRGGSLLFLAALAQRLLPKVQLAGFDTWSGIPAGGAAPELDWHRAGEFDERESFADLQRLALGFGNVALVKGDFRDTAEPALRALAPSTMSRPIALCHIDCDTRNAVAAAFTSARPFMMPGGYWVFDDALHASCLGAMTAIEDVVVRGAGLSCEQNYPHLVFREPI